jgi:Bacterial PH domain
LDRGGPVSGAVAHGRRRRADVGLCGLGGGRWACGLVLDGDGLVPPLATETDVTNMRVVHKTGFIKRRTFEMSLDKVESVDVNQSILGRLMNYGDITIQGVGEGTQTISTIASPLAFRNAITTKTGRRVNHGVVFRAPQCVRHVNPHQFDIVQRLIEKGSCSRKAGVAICTKRRPRIFCQEDARPAGAATPANHSTEIYWFARAAAVAMYFE